MSLDLRNPKLRPADVVQCVVYLVYVLCASVSIIKGSERHEYN